MTMTDHAKDYVASRKALGLSFMKQERVLMRYAGKRVNGDVR